MNTHQIAFQTKAVKTPMPDEPMWCVTPSEQTCMYLACLCILRAGGWAFFAPAEVSPGIKCVLAVLGDRDHLICYTSRGIDKSYGGSLCNWKSG